MKPKSWNSPQTIVSSSAPPDIASLHTADSGDNCLHEIRNSGNLWRRQACPKPVLPAVPGCSELGINSDHSIPQGSTLPWQFGSLANARKRAKLKKVDAGVHLIAGNSHPQEYLENLEIHRNSVA